MGHSFGTIIVSAMIGGPNCEGKLQRPIDSVSLVQGAVSLWSHATLIMKQFYEFYREDSRVSPLVAQLPWSHHLIILA
jgi:hypothetical protein